MSWESISDAANEVCDFLESRGENLAVYHLNAAMARAYMDPTETELGPTLQPEESDAGDKAGQPDDDA